MPTTTELATRVLKRARVLDPNESPTAQEAADVIAVMQSFYDSMKERGHIQWTLTNIPAMYQDPFINVVAMKIAPDFGVLTTELVALGQAGMREIFALNERKIDGRTTPVVDF